MIPVVRSIRIICFVFIFICFVRQCCFQYWLLRLYNATSPFPQPHRQCTRTSSTIQNQPTDIHDNHGQRLRINVFSCQPSDMLANEKINIGEIIMKYCNVEKMLGYFRFVMIVSRKERKEPAKGAKCMSRKINPLRLCGYWKKRRAGYQSIRASKQQSGKATKHQSIRALEH